MRIQSPVHANVIEIDSRQIGGRRRREIRRNDMKFVDVMGTCCWQVGAKHPRGGRQKHLKTVDMHDIPFNVKSIGLKKC